jgi:hypothetical protein
MNMTNVAAGAALWICSSCALAAPMSVTSPDGHVRVDVRLTKQHLPVYAVYRDGTEVLRESSLGLRIEGADLSRALSGPSASAAKRISDHYEMAVGKKRSIDYTANERHFTFRDSKRHVLDVVFRVSNDGVAFRYVVADSRIPHKKFVAETTSFAFAPGARAWMQPIAVAQTGWSNVNPS